MTVHEMYSTNTEGWAIRRCRQANSLAISVILYRVNGITPIASKKKLGHGDVCHIGRQVKFCTLVADEIYKYIEPFRTAIGRSDDVN